MMDAALTMPAPMARPVVNRWGLPVPELISSRTWMTAGAGALSWAIANDSLVVAAHALQ